MGGGGGVEIEAPSVLRRKGPRIVVVGGGFGGVYASTYLAQSELATRGAEITLVDPKNFFTFTPLLAEVTGGTLRREDVIHPLRVLARKYGFEVRRDTVTEVDPDRRRVVTASGNPIPYDYAVIAVGATPRYFGNDGLRQNSLPFTSVDHAIAIRERVIDAMERASTVGDHREQEKILTFVIAGAGPAGVEIASEIRTLTRDLLRPYYPGLPEPRVILVSAGDRILVGWDEGLASAGLGLLEDRGIEVCLNTRILEAGAGRVLAEGPEGRRLIRSETLIWTAGTTPVPLGGPLPECDRLGGFRVTPELRVEGVDRLFAIGDAAALHDHRSGEPYPRVAPIAISQGVRAAANLESLVLGRPLEAYHAHHAGKIVSLGGGVALADVLGVRVTGPLAWWIYRGAYLMKVVGMKNKVRILLNLALNRVFEPDISSERVEPVPLESGAV